MQAQKWFRGKTLLLLKIGKKIKSFGQRHAQPS